MKVPDPSEFPQTVEFRVVYGFTPDWRFVDSHPYDFEGILKIGPQGIGIYRTGEIAGKLVSLLSWLHPAVETPSSAADTSVDAQGLPEHIIDLGPTQIIYDPGRRHVILRGPGASWPVVKLRRRLFSGPRKSDRDLLTCLERRLGKETVEYRSVKTYGKLYAIAVAIVAILLWLLFHLWWFTGP
ncbi:MAG TPA: hypothetical protein VMZ92_13175 [Planctomycetota bacterium]|nr:hypothetical protein [Planctomycetota bacterium]